MSPARLGVGSPRPAGRLARRAALGLLALALAASPAAAAPPSERGAGSKAPAGTLEAALAAIFDEPALARCAASVAVYDLAEDRWVFRRDPDRPLNPASNVKLFTTAAALRALGPDHRFTTKLVAERIEPGGVVAGPLWLVGGGDPSLTSAHLHELALELYGRGIRRIKGPITVDAERFDGDGWPPGFEKKREFAAYRAPMGAASVNFNTFEVWAVAHEGGSVHVHVEPPVPSIRVEHAVRADASARNRIKHSVQVDGDRIVVKLSGSLGTGADVVRYRWPVPAPARYAGEALALELGRVGIVVDDPTVQIGPAPRGRALASRRSDALSAQLRAINKLSNNFMAEMVLRALVPGPGATAEASLERLRALTGELGVSPTGLVLGNGSGLYDNNRASAGQVVALLRAVWGDFRIRADFVASLAIVGVDGTAGRRLASDPAAGWARVKTGTLDGVSALSGYVGRPGREPLVFSILVNDIARADSAAVRSAQDRAVRAMFEVPLR